MIDAIIQPARAARRTHWLAALWGGGVLLSIAAPAAAQTADGWRSSVSLNAWIASVNGQVGGSATAPPTNVDVSFGDIVKHLSFAFMGTGDVGYGRFGTFGDVVYMKVKANETLAGPGPLTDAAANVKLGITIATVSAYYRAVDAANYSVDLMAGGRLHELNTDVKLTLAPGPVLQESRSKSRVDPAVGVRGVLRMGPRSSLTGYADYAGFTSSKNSWQLYGGYNYRFNKLASLRVGYRHYALEFKNGFSVNDLTITGPQLGLTLNF